MRDLQEIHQYIAKENAVGADAFVHKLLTEAYSLHQLPLRGPLIKEKRGARLLVYQAYLIVYRASPSSSHVRILRFWHAARERIRL